VPLSALWLVEARWPETAQFPVSGEYRRTVAADRLPRRSSGLLILARQAVSCLWVERPGGAARASAAPLGMEIPS